MCQFEAWEGFSTETQQCGVVSLVKAPSEMLQGLTEDRRTSIVCLGLVPTQALQTPAQHSAMELRAWRNTLTIQAPKIRKSCRLFSDTTMFKVISTSPPLLHSLSPPGVVDDGSRELCQITYMFLYFEGTPAIILIA